MSKNNNRSEQQQVDVFESISSEATKDNIVTNEKEEKEEKEERQERIVAMTLKRDWAMIQSIGKLINKGE